MAMWSIARIPYLCSSCSLGWGFNIEWTPDCLNRNHRVYLNSLWGPLKHFNFCSYVSHVMKSGSTWGRKEKSSLVKALGCSKFSLLPKMLQKFQFSELTCDMMDGILLWSPARGFSLCRYSDLSQQNHCSLGSGDPSTFWVSTRSAVVCSAHSHFCNPVAFKLHKIPF